jgi:hypothetical protein
MFYLYHDNLVLAYDRIIIDLEIESNFTLIRHIKQKPFGTFY